MALAHPLYRSKLVVLLFFSLIILISYWPSLDHFPRGDHWDYLIETIDGHGFADIFAKTYSYNRQRQVGPGDTGLFRPVLFGELAFLKSIAGPRNFALWQAVGISLHIIASFLMYYLLQSIVRLSSEPETSLLFLLTLSVSVGFALNPAIVDQVIWTHISGYLVFVILLEISVLALVRFQLQNGDNQRLLFLSWVSALLAAFCYELGQFVAPCLGIILYFSPTSKSGTRKFQALFFAVPVTYFFINQLDQVYWRHQYTSDTSIEKIIAHCCEDLLGSRFLRAFSYTALEPFFGYFSHYTHGGFSLGLRLSMRENTNYIAAVADPLIGLMAMGWLVSWVCLIVWRIKNSRIVLSALTLPISLIVVYLCYLTILVLGRMNFRDGPDVLSAYYAYIGHFLFTVATFSFFSISLKNSSVNRVANWAIASVVFGGLLFAFLGGIKINHELHNLASVSQDFRRRVKLAEEEINRLPIGSSLGFEIAPEISMRWRGIDVETILFREFVHRTPSHIVSIAPSGITTRQNNGSEILYLERPGRDYNVYSINSKFFGFLNNEVPSLAAPHIYSIEASSLRDAIDEASRQALKHKMDIVSGLIPLPHGHVQLEVNGFNGFNILSTGGVFIAIPQGPEFDFNLFNQKAYRKIYTGLSTIDVQTKILSDLNPKPQPLLEEK